MQAPVLMVFYSRAERSLRALSISQFPLIRCAFFILVVHEKFEKSRSSADAIASPWEDRTRNVFGRFQIVRQVELIGLVDRLILVLLLNR